MKFCRAKLNHVRLFAIEVIFGAYVRLKVWKTSTIATCRKVFATLEATSFAGGLIITSPVGVFEMAKVEGIGLSSLLYGWA
jgi:hypothetical protein